MVTSVAQWFFAPFRLDPATACLWRSATAVALPPKAFDVLHYLVAHADRVVTKDALLDAVWPDTAVSDAVVRVAIGALRKALGDTASPARYIATVPRRGYRFVAPVTVVAPSTPGSTEALLFPAAPAPLPTPVTETCRRCGQVVPLPATWCHGCGQRLEAGAPAPPAAPSPAEAATLPQAVGAPPGPRLDTPIALAVPPTGAALLGERKQVTVLCADIRGTQELLHDLDPEVVQQLLEPALQAMIEAVRRYGGTVHQVQGDGVMALFGAPLAQEDHAIRACYAALAIQTALRVSADDVRHAYGRPVQCGIGLHAGEVVLRAMGHDLPQEYTVLGQTAYLAVCMEQLAPPETILLTAATMRLVEGVVRAKSWGPMPVKGMAEPVAVWELLGASDRRWRLQTARARGLTRFVGRQTELAALHAALTQAGAGAARGGRGRGGRGQGAPGGRVPPGRARRELAGAG